MKITAVDKYSKYGLMADLLIIALSVIVLGICKAALIFHFYDYSYFNLSPIWSRTFFDSPGSCLDLAGSFCTQLCRMPVMGTLLLGLLLVLLRRLVARSVGEGPVGLFFSVIPPMMMILFISGLDYSVYLSKYYGLMFSQVLGLVSSGLIYVLLTGKEDVSSAGILMRMLVISLCFPLIGFYALVAGFMISLHFASVCRKPFQAVAIALVCVVTPFVCRCSNMLYQQVNIENIFVGGLPVMDFVGNFVGFIPLSVAILVIFFIPTARILNTHPRVCALLSALAIISVFVFSNWDHNFNAQLAIEKAVSEDDWEKVLDIAQKTPNPTRPIVIYRNIALYRCGKLCDKMFEYPDGSEPFKSRVPVPMSLTYAPEAYLRTGLLNNAERWATELSVSYTKGLNRLKCLSKVALLSGDGDLASKYFYLIDKTCGGKKWTAKYKRMLSEPELIKDDPEFASILPLVNSNSIRTIIGDVAETTILMHFANVEVSGNELLEWKMASLMTLKKEAGFMDEFLTSYKDYPVTAIPRGTGQAAVLFGGISGDEVIYRSVFSIFKEDEKLLKRFSSFGHSMSVNPDASSEAVLDRYRSQYGKTYWFYYYFVNDISTN